MSDIDFSLDEPVSQALPEKALPHPARPRWQPLRSGLLNLFRFDQVEFPFADGRLLLRGNNGSGKSRVLALQLPFLLDGETSSHRVEPDGDPAKRMEWNLLMGEHEDRLGYTWIEFGRRDDEGNEHYLTLGCGLRATRGRGLHGKWFFITPLRCGRDFKLHNDRNQPLTQDKLSEVLGEHGTIYRQAREYRRAVNEQLFKLGARYEPLLELLIRLRQPKLSEKLDETVLSTALSEALTPLPQNLVNEVAESFRGLEADRDELTGFQRARDAVADFLGDYRLYVQVAARRRAEAVRLTHSAYESNQRKQREAEEHHTRANSAQKDLEVEKTELEDELLTTRQVIRTLRESPEMHQADDIDRARKDAEQAEQRAKQSADDTKKAEDQQQNAAAAHQRGEAEAEKVATEANAALAEARNRAAKAGLTSEHSETFPRPAEDHAPVLPADLTATRRSLDATVAKRREAIKIMRAKNRIVSETGAEQQRAAEAQSAAADTLAEAKSHLREVENALETTADEQFTAYRKWAAACAELQPADAETLAEAWDAWLDHLDGESPLTQARAAASEAHIRACTQERSQIEADRKSHLETISLANEEIDRLKDGAQKPPEPSLTRPAERSDRPGAPFWMLCDFHDDLPASDCAGLEAALQASGLLDAWVLPDGTAIDPNTEDAFLISDTPGDLAPEKSLARFLKPAVERESTADASPPSIDAVKALLGRIATSPESGQYWVAPDSAYRLGPLQGRWSKDASEYIGESSRAAARKRRIAQLEDEIRQAETDVRHLHDTLEALAEREATARGEADAAPTDAAVREGGYQAATARRGLLDATNAEERAREQAEHTAKAHREALEDRNREADDLRLTEWVDHLDALNEHLGEYVTALAALWPTLDNWLRARTHAEEARLRLEQCLNDLTEKKKRQQHETQAAAAARQHHATLEASSGKEVREILAKLKEAEDTERNLTERSKTNEKHRIDAASELARAEESLRNLEDELARRLEEREKAVHAFQQFISERLLADAHEQLATAETDLGSISRAVELARRTDQILTGVKADDDTWSEQQQAIHHQIELLRDNLVPQGHSPDTRQMGELLIVRIPFRGSDCSVSELHTAFSTEIEDRGRLLDERERTVIENHLLSEAATEIQRLLREAEEWVLETNRELESRPTSTGMRLRFAWEPDPEGPAGLKEARDQLRQRAELWSEEQRLGLARFFQQRIEAERIENPSASWPDLLFKALDYRRWHRFSIERQQNNQWKRLTRRTHGTGSGGEKAIALTIPQFAAAAAHYQSAAPEAPRLILLDEVFVGIDSEMRANCMALLTQFDLDFIMTSEREWGCYPSLPALSICQLSTRPGFKAVAVTRWAWNGHDRKRDA